MLGCHPSPGLVCVLLRYVVQVGEGDEAERKKQLFECFEERAIHMNEEGLVVKDLHGHYRVCALLVVGRRGYAWYGMVWWLVRCRWMWHVVG